MGDGLGVELARRREARAHRVDVRSAREPALLDDGLDRRGRRADDLGSEEGRVDGRRDDRADLAREALGRLRLRDQIRISGSSSDRSHRSRRGRAPARRRRGSRRAARPARASARVATAETAAVRISVIGDAFRIATSSPVVAVVQEHAALCVSSPRAGLVGTMTISFKADKGAALSR